MTSTYTARIIDKADDPDALAAAIGELDARGYRVECDALDGRLRRQRRDKLLREVHDLMPGTSTWARCLRLSEEISKLERRWPALREQEALREGNRPRSLLFQARQCGELPVSPRQLYTIVSLKRGGAGHFSGERD